MKNDNVLYQGEKITIGLFLLRMLQGFLIGGGAVLPGISGGVLCVAFGIYQPMMAFIAHPFKTFRTYFIMFIPIVLGAAIGFVGLADTVTMLYETSEAIACCLFVGLVAGTLPSLIRQAGKQGTSNKSWTGFVICLFVVFGVLAFLENAISMTIEVNLWWNLFGGIVWGLSLIVPGLSSSSILIYMGVYNQITDGVGRLDLGVIIPLFVGIAGVVFLFARLVNYVYNRHFSLVSHMILGFIISSTLLIMPSTFKDSKEIIISIIVFFGGFAIAWGMDKFGERIKKD